MFTSKGIIHYNTEDGMRVIMKVDQDISNYCRTLIPPYLRIFKQGYPAHITVVRPGFDNIVNLDMWAMWEGMEVEYLYETTPLFGKGYAWINAWSKQLEELRTGLGLINHSKYPNIPSGFNKTFHITIGKYTEVADNSEAPEK